MKIMGFNETSVKWFHSYLSERTQKVMIGSSMSEPVELTLGSPQGSILSPSIFLILISDMELYCPGAQICSYADDTTVTVSVKNSNVTSRYHQPLNFFNKFFNIKWYS